MTRSPSLCVPVANLHTVTLRIEPDTMDAGKATLQWAQPIFIRR